MIVAYLACARSRIKIAAKLALVEDTTGRRKDGEFGIGAQ